MYIRLIFSISDEYRDILDENNQSIDVAFPNHSIAIEIDVVNNTGAEIDKIDEFTVSIESLFGEGYVVLNNVQLGRKITLKPGINTIRFDIPNLPLNSGVSPYLDNNL